MIRASSSVAWICQSRAFVDHLCSLFYEKKTTWSENTHIYDRKAVWLFLLGSVCEIYRNFRFAQKKSIKNAIF